MRNICLVTSTRADFSKTEALLERLLSDSRFEVHLIVSGSHLLIESGFSCVGIRKKYPVSMEVHTVVAGDDLLSMSESVALGMTKFNSVFSIVKPDIVILHGDRYDALSAALSSSLLQIFTVHLEGGELSGTIDGSLRHAITKLCHLHFVCTEEAKQRVVQMGENPENVKVSGCLSYDRYATLQLTDILSKFALIEHKYYIVIHHPNTEDLDCTLSEYSMLLEMVQLLEADCIFFYPNIDPGNKAMIQLFNKYMKCSLLKSSRKIHKVTNIPFEDFATVLKSAHFVVGNSSAIVREACIFGTPAVVIGTRQRGRDLPANAILYDGNSVTELLTLISFHAKQRFPPCHMYGKGQAADKIVNTLHTVKLETVKEFNCVSV